MKILILIYFLFFVTGCVDYKELNSLSYITGMGIDYIDNEFVITYEVMDNKKEGATIDTNTYTITASGSSIYETGVNAIRALPSSAYFSHTQVIIISKTIAENYILELSDFVMRNPKLNEEFLLVMTDDCTPEDVLKNTSEENPSSAFYLYDMIKNNVYSQNYYIDMPFAVFVQKMKEEKMDPAISLVKIDENKIILDGIALFENDKYVLSADNDISNIYNSFINENTNIILNAKYNNDVIEAITKFEKIDVNVTANDIFVSLDVIVEIKKNTKDIDLNDLSSYENIEKKLSEELNNKIYEFINFLQKNNTDLLGLSNYYYIDTRKDNENLWRRAEINIDSNLTISRRGLITDVYN